MEKQCCVCMCMCSCVCLLCVCVCVTYDMITLFLFYPHFFLHFCSDSIIAIDIHSPSLPHPTPLLFFLPPSLFVPPPLDIFCMVFSLPEHFLAPFLIWWIPTHFSAPPLQAGVTGSLHSLLRLLSYSFILFITQYCNSLFLWKSRNDVYFSYLFIIITWYHDTIFGHSICSINLYLLNIPKLTFSS